MSNNAVGWFEIYVSEIERAKAFYEGVLSVTLQSLASPDGDGLVMWAFPMDPEGAGSSGAIVSMPGEQPTGNGTIVYFSCDDCAVEAARVNDNGGSIMKDKFSIGEYGFIALANDPDGNVIGLHSMK